MRVCEKDVDQAEIDLVPWHHIHHSGPCLLEAFCLLLYVGAVISEGDNDDDDDENGYCSTPTLMMMMITLAHSAGCFLSRTL